MAQMSSVHSQFPASRAGACLAGLAALWSVGAACISANLIISVRAETASYWLCLFIFILGGALYLGTCSRCSALGFWTRCACTALGFTVLIASWRLSDKQFLYWKMRAIPPGAWAEMVTDLEALGRQAANANKELPQRKPLPKSLQRLGMQVDYKGGMGNVWNSPDYEGVFANIIFGYKSRCWGLFLGPASRAKTYCQGGACIRVAPNAFFFIGRK